MNDIKVDFTIVGDAELINTEPAISEAGIASALLMIGDISGNVMLEAESEGLLPGKLEIGFDK